MPRTGLRTAGWAVVAALILAVIPATGAAGTTPTPAATSETMTPAPGPRPTDGADPQPEPTDPVAEPEPTEPAPTEPEPTPAEPEPTEPAPEPEPEPTEPHDHATDEEPHTDGPTMPLTREIPRATTETRALRLVASTGPQPVFHFPWLPGERWGASGSHADSDGINRGAIDFAPLNSRVTAVRAVAAGRVYRVSCAGGWFLGIDHGGGWMSEYYHLRKAKSSLVGTWVEAGTMLGYAGQTLPCGGTPGTSAHVHLSILNESIDVPSGKRKYVKVSGIQFDRFVLRDSSGAYNGVWRDMSGKTVLNSRRVTCCLTASSRVGPSSPKAVLPDADGNGIDDRSEAAAWDTDLNSDGRADVVGFGIDGVKTALGRSASFASLRVATPGFGTGTGWSPSKRLRMVQDVTGDGRPDIVGFGDSGVTVARGKGDGAFSRATRWSSAFGRNASWSVSKHVRTLADVNGDGLPDVVGFGGSGVSLALNTGSSFRPSQRVLFALGADQGWNTTRKLRLAADVTGDGRADLVGFANSAVYVAESTGTGFRKPEAWSRSFTGDNGWRADVTPRRLADMDGDGLLDIVGFARSGVYVALNIGSSFASPKRWAKSFGLNSSSRGWKVDRDPRTLGDVDGDGLLDIVGFRRDGTYVALNTGSTLGAAKRWTTDYGSREWTLGLMPRAVADVNGDGRADIVGFARHGVHVALSSGSRFGAAAHWSEDYGWGTSTGNWRVTTKPRGVSGG
ncbi:FG-GAP-like repeat-containing protein [Microbacterium sp. 179-B 1A2 NHS]|uniref:FG-GAP-like repeat-containing protein n=1 Tax=Microbacterium sp. 179-B 1A2 NHS TaxID=3142383 RepID=UPI0039A3AEAA